MYCFHSCIIDECEHLLSFFYMNLSDFSVNFCLLFSCAVRLKCLFQTCCCFAFESHASVCESSHSAQVSQTAASLFSLGAVYCSLLHLLEFGDSSLTPHLSTDLRSSLSNCGSLFPISTLGLAVILMSSFWGEAHVQLLCCCCLQKAFFQRCLVCQALNFHPQVY